MIYNEGMNDVNEKLSHMTVCVRVIIGKTISNSCVRRQSITIIKHEIRERETKIPKALQHLSNQWKTLNERKTIQEHNIINEATFGTAGWNERSRNDDFRRIS